MATAVATKKLKSSAKTKARVAKGGRTIIVSKKVKSKSAKSMVLAGDVVRARIDHDTKVRATKTLDAIGLNISDAIRLMLRRVADEQRLPFDVKVPNRETAAAISELESGKGNRANSVKSLMADLNADD